jgi:hypothetical protein
LPHTPVTQICAEAQRDDHAVARSQSSDRFQNFIGPQLVVEVACLLLDRPPVGQQLKDKTLSSCDPAGIPAGIDHDAPEPALDLTLRWVECLQPSDRTLQCVLARSSALEASMETSCANL